MRLVIGVMLLIKVFLDPEESQSPTTVVVVLVVTPFEKCLRLC